MKRLLCFLITLLVLVSGITVLAEEPNIEVLVDSEFLQFTDQPPVMRNDRVLVPLRAIFEALGARVYYDDETKLITAKRNLTTIELTVGSDKLYVNGVETIIDTPAFVQNGRTLVPVRAVSEALGVTVDWDEETPCVIISSLFWEHYAKIESITESYIQDGKNITIECYYPQLRSKKENIIKTNNKIKNDAENYVKNVKESVSSYNETELKFERDFLITYDFDKYFSYIVQDTVNGSDLKQSSFNMNTDTQKLLQISNFISFDAASESSLEYNSAFLNHISNQPDKFYSNAQNILEENDYSNQFYLTYKGFAYFANPGVLSDASNGVITIEIEN